MDNKRDNGLISFIRDNLMDKEQSPLDLVKLEILERDSGLPPKTLFNLKMILKRGDERSRHLISKLKKELEEIKDSIDQNKKEKEREKRIYESIVNYPENFKRKHLDDELLALDIGIESYEFKETETLKEVLNEIKSRERAIIVLKGPTGIGKSTLMYQIAKNIEDRYLTVFLRGGKVEYFDKYFLNNEDKDIALFVSYNHRMDESDDKNIGLRDILDRFLKSEDSEIFKNFKFLIIEVRSEYYERFKKILEEIDEYRYSIKKHIKEFDLKGLSEDKAKEIIDFVANDKKLTENEINEILRVSKAIGGVINPLILIVATKVIVEGGKIDKENSPIDVVWKHLQTTLSATTKGTNYVLKEAVEWIALTKAIRWDDLVSLLKIKENLVDYKYSLMGLRYVSFDENNSITIIPELFNDVIFIKKWLDIEEVKKQFDIGEKSLDYIIERFIEKIIEIKLLNEKYLLGVSTNITNAYRFDKYKDICKKLSEELLKIVDYPEVYSDALLNLVYADIPIENIDYDKLIDGSEITAKRIAEELSKTYRVKQKPEPELAIENIISKLCVNYLENGLDEKIKEVINEITNKCKEKLEKFNEEQFLVNTYSMIVSKIAQKYDNPNDKKEWLNEIYKLIDKKAKNFDEVKFLINTYSMIIRRIAEHHKPEDKKKWLERIFNLAEEKKLIFGEKFIWWFNLGILFHINEIANIIHPQWYKYLIEKEVLDNALYTWRLDVIVPFIEKAILNIEDEHLKQYLWTIYDIVVEDDKNSFSYYQKLFNKLLEIKYGNPILYHIKLLKIKLIFLNVET